MQERDDSWMAFASCKGAGELFYPHNTEVTKRDRALEICSACPVREQCLDHALAIGEHHGIWGGTTEKQRQRIRRHLLLLGTQRKDPA